jgi:hypothetical protein
MAVTFDEIEGSACIPLDTVPKMYVIKNRVTLDSTAVSTDIVQALPVRASTVVLGTYIKMVTAAVGTTCTATVGITGGTANGFDASVDLKSVAGSVIQSTPSDTYPAAGGFYTAAADTIDLVVTVDTLTTFPVFDIWAICIDLS